MGEMAAVIADLQARGLSAADADRLLRLYGAEASAVVGEGIELFVIGDALVPRLGRIDDLPAILDAERIGAPALVIVGEVVRLRGKLDWFDAARLLGDARTQPRCRSAAIIWSPNAASSFSYALRNAGSAG